MFPLSLALIMLSANSVFEKVLVTEDDFSLIESNPEFVYYIAVPAETFEDATQVTIVDGQRNMTRNVSYSLVFLSNQDYAEWVTEKFRINTIYYPLTEENVKIYGIRALAIK